MPTPTRILSSAGVRRELRDRCLPPGDDRVGLEVEWLTVPRSDPSQRLPVAQLAALVDGTAFPGGSRITFEPGAQLELSSPPVADAASAVRAIQADAQVLGPILDAGGVDLLAVGLDPSRPDVRVTTDPRYAAMEAFFDGDGPDGRRMMCGTAAVQINIGAGDDPVGRWRRAHLLGPVLTAAFANSPVHRGRPTGWRSTRMATWLRIDPSRTAPVLPDPEAWTAFALGAKVMLIREERCVPRLDGLTLGAWLENGSELGWPTPDDVAYHLTTLFPPIRPRGWLEVRMVDMVPAPWWAAATGLVATLLTDAEAGTAAERACAPVADRWEDAARHGLAHPGLRTAAAMCFRVAAEAAQPELREPIAGYHDRYVARGLTPADETLATFAAGVS